MILPHSRSLRAEVELAETVVEKVLDRLEPNGSGVL